MIGMAQGHYNAGSYIDAAKCADRFVANFPFFIAGLRAAILCYVGAGRLGDAQKVLGEILRLSRPRGVPNRLSFLLRNYQAINLKTAESLGIEIPTSLIVRADEVIK